MRHRSRTPVGFLAWLLVVVAACSSDGVPPSDGAPRDLSPPDATLPARDVADDSGDATTPPPDATEDAREDAPPARDEGSDASATPDAAVDSDRADTGATGLDAADAVPSDEGGADAGGLDRDAADVAPPDAADVAPSDTAADVASGDGRASDAGPATGALSIRLTAPSPGAVLTGMATLRYVLTLPEGRADLAVLLDGREVYRAGALSSALYLDTTTTTAGPHRLGVALIDARGARATDEVAVVVDNPPFRLQTVTPDQDDYANGEMVTLGVVYSAPGVALSADFAALDSAYDATRVAITDEGSGRFTVRYRIAATNRRADGTHAVVLTARDRTRPERALASPVPVRLANTPPMPFTVGEGHSLDAPWMRLPEAATGLAVASVTGTPTILRGGTTRLDIGWTARPGVPVRAVQVSVEGFAGYWNVLVTDPAATRASLTVGLPAVLPRPPRAGTYRLVFRLLDAAFSASPPRTFELRIEDLGRGGGGGGMVTYSGRVHYLRLTMADSSGACALFVPFAIRRPLLAAAVVRAVRVSDGTTLAQTSSAAGRYTLTFPAPGTETVRLEVVAGREEGMSRRLNVNASLGRTHVWLEGEFTPTPGVVSRDIMIHRLETSAAFHIFQVMSEMWAFSESATGRPLDNNVSVLWETGREYPSCGRAGSCADYSPSSMGSTIYIAGGTTDPDEWDDAVLRHEFGHIAHAALSAHDYARIDGHSPGSRSDPRVAWAEGFASFWGALQAADTCYSEWSPTGSYSFVIDDADPDHVPINTFDSTRTSSPYYNNPSGTVSEGVVSGSLWRLRHFPAAVLWSIFEYTRDRARPRDGGGTGIDFVDFLDGWLCAEPCAEAEMRQTVVGLYQFPHVPVRDRSYCPALPPGTATHCAARGVLALTPTGLARVAVTAGMVTPQPFSSGLEVPLGSTLADGLTLPRRALALVRPYLPGPTRALALNPSERTVSLVSLRDGDERELDIDNDTTTTFPSTGPAGISRIELTAMPRALAVSPDGRLGLVGLERGVLSVIDLDARRLCYAVPLAPATNHVEDVVVNADGTRAYAVLAGAAGAVSVIDLRCVLGNCARPREPTPCPAVSTTIPGLPAGLADEPTALALSPDGRRLAIAVRGRDLIALADTATNTLIDATPREAGSYIATGDMPQVLTWSSDNVRMFAGHERGFTGTALSNRGTVRRVTTDDGRTDYDVGVDSGVFSLLLGADEAWLYIGDRRGHITAVPTAWFTGRSGFPRDGTGGCLTAGRTVPCTFALRVSGAVRALVALPAW